VDNAPGAAAQRGPALPRILRIALDTPLRRLFDYRASDVQVTVGCRVRVPFGRQSLVGVVWALADSSDVPAARLRDIEAVLDAQPVLGDDLRALLQWSAGYYQHPVGAVVAAALPKLLRDGEPASGVSTRWHVTPAGLEALAAGQPSRAPRQRQLLALLATAEQGAAELGASLPQWRELARSLIGRGWVAAVERPESPSPGAGERPAVAAEPSGPLDLSEAQAKALAALQAGLGRFGNFLLDGVTGSGKTEVYLQLIDAVLARGESALVLCPEIGLTPQLLARFTARFTVPVAALHSGLTDRERLAAWRLAANGTARIVIGTRSAVFAPLAGLGVIVVDEEHDASFKQHEGGFRYSARDLAVVRAQQAGVPVVLGSATPSLESLHNVERGRATHLSLPQRAGAGTPPRVQLVDLRNHAVHRGLSTPLAMAIDRHLQDGGQVLVFLNRRGYAPTLMCNGCGWVAPCTHCDARLTVHQRDAQLACHHCGATAPLPQRCERCGHGLRTVGHGTERIEETLAERYPGIPIARFDRDVVRGADELAQALDRVTSGEARILVGTQMLTKGHHFPDVTLVGILNADQSLFSTDFRAAERLAQTIVQVAGRAGRAGRAGEVLIQTEFPGHPLLQELLSHGYGGFARQALAERAAAAWPPYGRLALVRASGVKPEAALAFLAEARRVAAAPAGVELRGPVPAAMVRRAGRHHAQLLVESSDRGLLQRFLAGWLPRLEALESARGLRWALDVDPLEVF
jgi:primosomal protein N' (replication factor Y) (superfamily II helicase)